MALQHEEYQKAREPRVAPWLRRPVDVVDEIGRDTPRIPYVQPRNNIHWSLEEIAAMNKEKDDIVSCCCYSCTACYVRTCVEAATFAISTAFYVITISYSGLHACWLALFMTHAHVDQSSWYHNQLCVCFCAVTMQQLNGLA
jgi:hypothetical protein